MGTHVCGVGYNLDMLPCVGVCGYPVRTECGHACGGQDLQTHFFIIYKGVSKVLPYAHLTVCLPYEY